MVESTHEPEEVADMSDLHPEDPSGTPITEVVVLRHGEEIHRQLCESEAEAAAIIAHWEEQPGVECEVIDLAAGRGEEAAEIDWTDRAADYPAGGPEPEAGYEG